MKVLWFSNTQANAVEYLNRKQIGGGWLKSLDKELQNKVDLNVAFLNPNGPKSFKHNKTTYHSIMPTDWKKRLIFKSLFAIDTERDDTQLYLEIVDRVRPDIIHIHGTESGFIQIIKKLKSPVLLSIQGNLTVYYHKFNAGLNDTILKSTYVNKGFSFNCLIPTNLYNRKKY